MGFTIAVCGLVLLVAGPYLSMTGVVAQSEDLMRLLALVLALLGIGVVQLHRFILRLSPERREADDLKWAKVDSEAKKLEPLTKWIGYLGGFALILAIYVVAFLDLDEMTKRIVGDVAMLAVFAGIAFFVMRASKQTDRRD